MTHLDWDLLTLYLAGDCTPAEREWLERHAAVDGDVSRAVAAARRVAADSNSPAAGELEERLAAVKRDARLLTAEPIARSTARLRILQKPRIPLAAAAAFALLLLGGGAAAWLASRRVTPPVPAPQPAYTVISTGMGQRLAIRLPDSTGVTLAPATRLRFAADFGRRDRVVDLDGEAVFTVTHDTLRPFAVRTTRALATDLGTRFAIRAYPEDSRTDVVVAEGRVAVRPVGDSVPAAPADSLLLSRGERARISSGGKIAFARGVALDEYFGWTEGRLVFRDAPLAEVAARLERWYDIEVRLSPAAIGNRRLRASVGNEQATEVLQTIAVSLGLRLSRAGRVFTLAPD